MQNITLTTAQSIDDLQQILDLQQRNLRTQLAAVEIQEEGFVTVVHNLGLLAEMNHPHPHIISKARDAVVGFALVMDRAYGDKIAVLKPMVEIINKCTYEGLSIGHARYIIMGQICIAKAYRKQGLFRKMYSLMETRLKPFFDYIITEIDAKNTRSLQAHLHTGFKVLKRYDADNIEWVLVIKKI